MTPWSTAVAAGMNPAEASAEPEELEELEEDELYPGDVEDAMPEGELSYDLANYVKSTIRRLVADRERDSVHANMPIYYQRGTKKLVAPDVFFARGVPHDERRRSFRLWTARPPQVVFEILSVGHEKKDVDVNRFLFERLGIEEYYWFDPETTTLMALQLDPATGRYRPRTPQPNGRYDSPNLGLEVGIESDLLGLYDHGAYVPPPLELLERFRQERDALEVERDVLEVERHALEVERNALLLRVAELEERLRGEGR